LSLSTSGALVLTHDAHSAGMPVWIPDRTCGPPGITEKKNPPSPAGFPFHHALRKRGDHICL
jgi:hypothetical protein